jgi:hypothetical protein
MLAALAGLGLFAVGSRRVGMNEACKIKTASGDEIDFNGLASKGTAENGDYFVYSQQFDRYEYLFNICDKLNYKDAVCVDGSAACDRSISSEEAVAVWGSAANLTVTEQSYNSDGTGAKVWTMEMDSKEACYYRPQKVTVFKVFFLCNADATEPILSIKYEDYLECEVDINLETALACGSGPTKYSCVDGKCTASNDGTQTFADCSAKCATPNPPAPPPPGFVCDPTVEPGVCSESPGGTFPTSELCATACKYEPPKYACLDARCQKDPAGKFDTEGQCMEACKPGPPVEKKYRCDNDDKCVEAETGADQQTCKAVCEAADRGAGARGGYRCAEGKVIRAMFGGADFATVSALCGTVPPAVFQKDAVLKNGTVQA